MSRTKSASPASTARAVSSNGSRETRRRLRIRERAKEIASAEKLFKDIRRRIAEIQKVALSKLRGTKGPGEK